MSAAKIFISHISNEKEIAAAVKSQLDDDFLGLLDIFVSSDLESISAGKNWLDEVEDHLSKADILIILCSKNSIGRPWVNFEAGAVWLRKVPIIPVCHSTIKL